MSRQLCSTLGLVLLLTALTGCGNKPVLGVLLPLTGSASGYGESIESGIKQAYSQAQELDQMPANLEVVWLDTASDPQQAASELRTLADRGCKLVVGGVTSGEARAMLPVLEDLQIVCLSPSASSPSLTKDSKLFFRIFPSDQLEGNAAGKFLRDRMKKETVLLYVGDTEYTRGFEPEFLTQYRDNLGGKVVGRVDLTASSWEEQSKELLATRPDAVYIIGYADLILTVLRHLDQQGFAGVVLTTSAFYNSDIIQEAGALAEDVLFPLPPFDRTSEAEPVVSFVQRYMDTHQRAPDTFAAHGYDAMRLALEVLRVANPLETNNIKKTLHFGFNEFIGVTGPIMFDEIGDVKHYPKMFVIKDGQVLGYQRYRKAERERIFREVQELLVKEKKIEEEKQGKEPG